MFYQHSHPHFSHSHSQYWNNCPFPPRSSKPTPPATGTPITVKLPDGHHMKSTGTTSIDWPALPPTARTTHVLPQLDPHSLISTVSIATTTASPLLTKNRFKSTNTTPQSSKAPTYQMVSGVYPYIPNNHEPMPCSPNNHNENSFNGSMLPPSVQVSALSSRQPNEMFSSPGPTLHPKSFAGTYNHPLPLPKAISTNNDNVTANLSMKKHHQHTSPHALTPFTQGFVIPNNQLATPSVISLADSQFIKLLGQLHICSL